MREAALIALENWKPIPGFEDLYSASDIGRIRTCDRILKPGIDPRGYRRVNLMRGRSASFVRRVHILVAATFIGPRPEGEVIRHLDGDSLNNCIENLRYGTHRENSHDTLRHGRHAGQVKTHCPRNHALEPPNLMPSAKGHRKCLACNRAQNRLRLHPELDLAATADAYHSEILSNGLGS